MLNRRNVLVGASALAGAAAMPAIAGTIVPMLSGNFGDQNDLTIRGVATIEEMRELLPDNQVTCLAGAFSSAYCDPALIGSFGHEYLVQAAMLPAIFEAAAGLGFECGSLTLACESGADGVKHQRMLISYRDAAGAALESSSEPIHAGVDFNEVAHRLGATVARSADHQLTAQLVSPSFMN